VQVIAYELKIDGVDVAIRNQKQLKEAVKLLNRELLEVEDANRYKEIQRDLGALKGIQKQVRDETRKNQRAFLESAEKGSESYRELQFRLTRLKNEYKDLGREARESGRGLSLQGQISSITQELKTIDKGFGDSFRNVGNYKSAVSGAFGALKGGLAAAGIGLALDQISQALISSIKLFADFTNQVAILQAVSGASADEVAKLRDRALELGETTQFTASQVAQLQINFARVGFDTQAIDNATESTLDLALATGEDLAESADVVAATLGGYQLSARETKRVNDVLAQSFNSSALQLDTFRESTKNVAPVAASVGIQIEEATASIAALADVGIRGSRSGTALRRVFTDLGTESSKLSQEVGFVVESSEDYARALDVLQEKQIGVSEATELVGREAATALTALVAQRDSVASLSQTFNEAGEAVDQYGNKVGAAAAAASIVEDTLTGDINKFRSALEGFQLFFVDLFDNTIRGVVQGATSLFQPLQATVEFLFEAFRPLVDEVGALVSELFRGTDPARRFGQVLDFIRNTLVLTISIITQTVRGLRLFVQVVKDTIESSAFLSGVVDGLTNTFNFLRDTLVEIPNVLNGIITAYGALRDAFLGEGNFSDVGAAFTEGAEASRRYAGELDNLKESAEGAGSGLQLTKDQTQQLNDLIRSLGRDLGLSSELLAQIAADAVASADSFEDAVERINQAALRAFANQSSESGSAAPGGGGGSTTADRLQLPADGSVDALRGQIQELKREVERQPANNALRATFDEIIEKEQELQKAEETLARLRIEAEGGREAITDRATKSLEELANEARRAANLPEVNNTIGQIDTTVSEEGQEQAELAAIERRSLRQIEALQSENLNFEAYQARKTEILEEAELERLRTQLKFTEEGSQEYRRIKNQMYEAELEAGKEAKQGLVEVENDFLAQVRDIGLNALQSVVDAQFEQRTQAAKEAADERLRIAEEERDERLEGVERGSLEEKRIEQEFEREKIELQKQAAREQQRIKIQQAIANTALAIGNALATVQPFVPNAVAAAALAAIRGAAQVAVLQSQSFAAGGVVDGPSHSQGGVPMRVRSTGQRVELEGQEGVINKKSMRSTRVVHVSGTPAEIASAINKMDGNGVPFPGVRAVPLRYKFQDGGMIPGVPATLASSRAQGSIRVQTELSGNSIEAIEAAVLRGSAVGTKTGTKEGTVEANKRKGFEDKLNNRINV